MTHHFRKMSEKLSPPSFAVVVWLVSSSLEVSSIIDLSARRVPRAETWLTVYRPLSMCRYMVHAAIWYMPLYGICRYMVYAAIWYMLLYGVYRYMVYTAIWYVPL